MGVVNGINVVFQQQKKVKRNRVILKDYLIFPFCLFDHIYLFFVTTNVCHTVCHNEKVG